ncbi:AAA family ATPase [Rathayibacter sp. AY1E2]|uniref:AAA family ATPase n=1 Tax=Rathayibacter sp. AY1E2 TaxID=2080550 RepID=UPI000CE7D2CE|nr:AAA family ATPase [Rathayibacter sp. AY1E2]PPH51930.1 hypothetical protein C5C49_10150 [Rathayibacter sp. AY1E2]
MDLQRIETQARALLHAASRYTHPTEKQAFADLAANGDVSWREDPERVRLNARSIDVLERLRFIEPAINGYGSQISQAGRRALSDPALLTEKAQWLDEWIELEELREQLDLERASSTNTLSELTITNWRQFSAVSIVFHSSLTVLTGANGAGKTTLLNILGPHFNWPAQLLVSGDDRSGAEKTGSVGTLYYSNGARTDLLQSHGSGTRNAPLQMSSMQTVPGIFINSHRSVSFYQPLESLPPRFSESDTLLQQFSSEIQVRYAGGASNHSPLYRMKEALVAAAMYAYGNTAVRQNEAARDVWEGYQRILRTFLPKALEFDRLLVDDAEIILVTKNAEFPLEAVSGGIGAMLELSWQIFLRQRNQLAFTVCIDEPENHLHPELQRSLIPSLLRAFPNVNFIVATHSPLVVTAVRDANVYALSKGEDGRVRSRRVENINPTATPDETLMSVLGLDSALPIWAETELEGLMSGLGESPSADELRAFRSELKRLGLDRQFPAAVRAIEARG